MSFVLQIQAHWPIGEMLEKIPDGPVTAPKLHQRGPGVQPGGILFQLLFQIETPRAHPRLAAFRQPAVHRVHQGIECLSLHPHVLRVHEPLDEPPAFHAGFSGLQHLPVVLVKPGEISGIYDLPAGIHDFHKHESVAERQRFRHLPRLQVKDRVSDFGVELRPGEVAGLRLFRRAAVSRQTFRQNTVERHTLLQCFPVGFGLRPVRGVNVPCLEANGRPFNRFADFFVADFDLAVHFVVEHLLHEQFLLQSSLGTPNPRRLERALLHSLVGEQQLVDHRLEVRALRLRLLLDDRRTKLVACAKIRHGDGKRPDLGHNGLSRPVFSHATRDPEGRDRKHYNQL